ncbi:hypothetical protein BG011_007613 [Mortierella polycephala]|uniref:Chitin-binding type-4 domain-containing protein n=1 Tax=Mortierella polycephala TaxID=41804 RepID=A0A9P6TXH4_9FUNG|nr:hypothetical protein BG011_007613 [Mortierella polycephala]
MVTRLCVLWTIFVVASLLIQTTLAHMALLYPMPRGGIRDKKQYNGKVHAFIGFDKKRTLPCNGYDRSGPITQLRAGQIIDVRFWGPALQEKFYDNLPPRPSNKRGKQINQARHGGGFCQFSLTYDGGKTFHLIGEYTESCPDFYYAWKVKIPDNVPSCNETGKCFFIWSWTAVNVPQFYMNCVDVKIQGKVGGKLPSKGIQIVNAPGYQKGVTAKGDGAGDMTGDGPNPDEVRANVKGTWS